MDVKRPLAALSRSHLWKGRRRLVYLIVLAALLQAAACAGMAYVAGFSSFRTVVDNIRWQWIGALVGALVLSFVGYYYATRGVYRVDHGPRLDREKMRATVIAGFGGFLAHGGTALDKYALQSAGAEEHDADVRVSALAGMEHGILGIFGTAAGVTILVAGLKAPPPDFTVPWAVIPVPGFLIAFYLAPRYAERFAGAGGWRGRLGTFLQSIAVVRRLFTGDLRRHPAVPGMIVFWAAEMFAVWAGVAAFGFHMNAAQLVVGVGTGMVFTRRTAPLGGAGILIVTLAATVWYSGAPLAAAILGVFAYRVLSLWLPMPFALAQLPTLWAMGEREEPGAEGRADSNEPALPDERAS